jgi:hypothetical protein
MDFKYYRFFNNDLNNFENEELEKHYNDYGKNENRIISEDNFYNKFKYFDYKYYKNKYDDLKNLNKIELEKHFYFKGIHENRSYNIKIDTLNIIFYKEYYDDLKNLSNNELIKHYYKNGIYENRLSNINYLNIKINLDIKEFYTLYPYFNLEFYKKFNTDLNFNYDIEFLNHYNLKGNKLNKKYYELDIDFTQDNYLEKINKNIILKNKIYNHNNIRNIKKNEELINFNKNYEKKFYIFNNNSFYEYYNDFDLDFYKKKYFLNGNKSDFNILLYYHLEGKYKNEIINNKIKIIIYTPPFDIKCGGIVVLHYLAKIINNYKNNKFYAKLFIYNNLRYNNIFCNNFARIDEITNNTVVIYPEIITGNPLNCKNVVRWILLDLGIEMSIDHYLNWGKNDLIYHWEPRKNDLKKLTCHYINPIFYNKNINSRNKTCYLIKKGRLIHKNINYMHPSNSINIESLSLEEINEILNQCKYLYIYDSKSMFIIYSIICGCIPVIYPLENISKEEYLKSSIFYKNNKIYDKGIAYGNNIEEIIFANNTLKEAIDEYNFIFNDEINSINSFLNDLNNLVINN